MPKALQKGERKKDAVSKGGDGRRGNQWPQEWHTYSTGCQDGGGQLGKKEPTPLGEFFFANLASILAPCGGVSLFATFLPLS